MAAQSTPTYSVRGWRLSPSQCTDRLRFGSLFFESGLRSSSSYVQWVPEERFLNQARVKTLWSSDWDIFEIWKIKRTIWYRRGDGDEKK